MVSPRLTGINTGVSDVRTHIERRHDEPAAEQKETEPEQAPEQEEVPADAPADEPEAPPAA